jgi:DNA polymerase III subunit epsilon
VTSRGRVVMVAGAGAALVLGLAAIATALWLGVHPLAALGGPAMLVLPLGGFGFALTLVSGYLLGRAFAPSHRTVIERLAQDTRIITAANSAHRVASTGAAAWDELVDAINGLAARYQSLQEDVEHTVAAATAGAEEEKNRLAALMAQLTQAVMVCSVDGSILLYNNSARQLLTPTSQPGAGGAGVGVGVIGLGRSIYPLLDRNLIAHGLESIRHRIEQSDPHPVANFVTNARSGQLVRIQMGPVSSSQASQDETPNQALPDITGFVLTLEDVTRSMEAASRTDAMVQAMTADSRASIANMRAAVETIMSFPDMGQEKREDFIRIINEEVSALGDKLAQKEAEYAASLSTQWSVEEIRADEFLSAVQRKIEHKLGIPLRLEQVPRPIWLRIDSYALVQAISYLASRLSYETGIREMTLRLVQEGRLVHVDLVCPGAPITVETWNQWEAQPLRIGGEASPLSLKTIMERHGGEAWHQLDQASRSTLFRLLIPLGRGYSKSPSAGQDAGVLGYLDVGPSRRPKQRVDLDRGTLDSLAYTAFFIGATGPHASGAQAIFSIGAIRIVGGRILDNEVFDELVDPGVPISAVEARKCGIEPSILEGRATIDHVLPAFWRFCQSTVLIAGDAASAMGLLRAKEVRTGTSFAQPILDPLRLFAGSRPTTDSSSLAMVAERLGVLIKSNARALDLARATAQVFLKLMPMLAERGISTLEAAKEVSGTGIADLRSKQ